MKYGINLTWNDLQKDAGALALVRQYLPAMEALASQAPGAARIAIRTAQGYAPQMFPAGQVAALDKALKAYGAAKPLSAEDTARVERYRALQAAHKVEAHPERAVRYDAFHPGRPWLDTNGNPIQAHGGAVYQEDGVWYWYGENKEFTDGKSPIWTWGIRMYRSTDLYNWQDLGLVALPDLTNPDGNLFPEKYVDRPHIIHCAATGKYVMWVKISSAEGCFTILQADRLQGPYTVVAEDYYPLGGSVGDFDLVVNGTQAYLYVDTTPKRVAGFALAPDFCSVTQEVSSQYEGLTPPFCREGVTLFAHGGKKYLITSGTPGSTPNHSDAAVADTWAGPFVPIGDPHVNDGTMASFNSQISQVFPVPGKNLYIAVADRWMPDHLLDGKSADAIRRVVASHYQPQHYKATAQEEQLFAARPDLERNDTSRSTYVWLPLTFVGGKPEIRWYDSWRLEDFA